MTTRRHEDPAENWRKRARYVLSQLKHNRVYALDSTAELGLAAFLRAFKDRHGGNHSSLAGESDLVELVERLAKHLPGLTRQLPSVAEDAFEVEWPVDPVTAQRAPNPWEKGHEIPGLMNLITQNFPKLAEHIRNVATDPHYLWKREIEKRNAEARAKQIEATAYDAKKHESNPFRTDNVAEQNAFVQSHTPLEVEVYRDEARPIRFPWSRSGWNRTVQNMLHRVDRELFDAAKAAELIEREWHAVYLAQAKADGEAARAAEAAAKAQLAA